MRPTTMVLVSWFAALAAPAQPLVVWDKTWEASHDERWVPVPVGTWPTDKGELLVRVAFSPGVSSCFQLIAGERKPPTEAKDFTIDSDTIEGLARIAHQPQSWSWWGRGSGRVRVQILWFEKKRDAKRWKDDHPFEIEIAPSVLGAPHPSPVAEPRGIPGGDPFHGLVTVVWEHVGDATEPAQWITGPGRTWDHQRGALLLRAAGGPHFRGLVWRVGHAGTPRELPPGDHLLDANVLERPAANPFEILLGGGGGSESFQFGLIGRGPARLQLCWLARTDLAQGWCHANPLGGAGPPAPGGVPGGPAAGNPPPLPFPPPSNPPPRPDPRFDPRTAPGFIPARFSGTLAEDGTGRPLSDVDVVIQLSAYPRTIYGGGRTDADGRYAFTVSVPALTPLVVRIPERRAESQARSLESPEEVVEFSAKLR